MTIGSTSVSTFTQSNTTSTIQNISVGVADTEQSLNLPTNTKRFIMRSRGTSTIKLAWANGESSTNFLTIKPYAVYENINLYTAATIYFQVDIPDIIEFEFHV